MSTLILPVVIYILEIMRYCIANKLFFNGKIGGWKYSVLLGVIYAFFIILCDISSEDLCLVSYIVAGIIVYFIFSGNWKVKIFRIFIMRYVDNRRV